MYKGVDGGITERRIGRSRPPVALFLPWGRFLATSSGRLRVGRDARGEGVSWFLVQLKSAAPVLAVGQIERVSGCSSSWGGSLSSLATLLTSLLAAVGQVVVVLVARPLLLLTPVPLLRWNRARRGGVPVVVAIVLCSVPIVSGVVPVK